MYTRRTTRHDDECVRGESQYTLDATREQVAIEDDRVVINAVRGFAYYASMSGAPDYDFYHTGVTWLLLLKFWQCPNVCTVLLRREYEDDGGCSVSCSVVIIFLKPRVLERVTSKLSLLQLWKTCTWTAEMICFSRACMKNRERDENSLCSCHHK